MIQPLIQAFPLRLCRIILVHGTWPAGIWRRPRKPALSYNRKALWFEVSSSFRIGLRRKFLTRDTAFMFYPFVWSGKLSVFARDKAAKRLATLPREGFKNFTGDSFVVIAHSYGGNVALRALHYPDSASQIDIMTLKPDEFMDVIRRRHALYDQDGTYEAIADWIWRNVRPPRAWLHYPNIDGQNWVEFHRKLESDLES